MLRCSTLRYPIAYAMIRRVLVPSTVILATCGYKYSTYLLNYLLKNFNLKNLGTRIWSMVGTWNRGGGGCDQILRPFHRHLLFINIFQRLRGCKCSQEGHLEVGAL